MEQRLMQTTGNRSTPIQNTTGTMLAIFSAEILIHFSNKIHGSDKLYQIALGNCLWFEITKMLIAV